MASSYVENEDSEESEECGIDSDSDSDSDVENSIEGVSEYQKTDHLKKELEGEDRVSLCSITFCRRNITLQKSCFCVLLFHSM